MANSPLANAFTNATGTSMDDTALFNYIRNNMPVDTQQMLPPYQAGQSFEPQGQSFMAQPKVFNDYLDTVAIKYGLIFQKVGVAKNPLVYFKRGKMPIGGKIESIVYDTIEPKMYRPDLLTGEDDVFAQNFGRIEGDTYVQSQDIESSNTVVDTQDTMFFQNITQFHTFLFGKIAQLVNGAVLDEYYQTKLVLSKAYADSMITSDKASDIKDLASKINFWSRKLRYFSRENNVKGINQATLVDDIVVLVPLNYSVKLDMDYFANVFNAEVARGLNIKMLEVDSFPDVWEYTADHTVDQNDIDKGYVSKREYPVGSVIKQGSLAQPHAPGAEQKVNGDSIGAIVLDRDALQLWDVLPTTLTTMPNPRKRYSNIFVNKKTMLMFVQALNSKAIIMDDSAIVSSDNDSDETATDSTATGSGSGSTATGSGSGSTAGGSGSATSSN